MASGEQNITALPVKTNTGVANSDYFMGIDSAEGYQILIRDVAKYIMENYNGSTLAGQAQTPKAAIDALNSNTYSLSGGIVLQANTDLDNLIPGNYYCYTGVAVVHGPFDTICGVVKVENSAGTNNNYLRQIYTDYRNNTKYIRIKNNTWGDWEKQPTRSEVDTLNSKTEIVEFGNATLARAAGDNTATITFTKTYTENPTVLLSLTTGEPTRFIPHIISRSKTGATIGLYNTGSAVATSTTVSWAAIGR